MRERDVAVELVRGHFLLSTFVVPPRRAAFVVHAGQHASGAGAPLGQQHQGHDLTHICWLGCGAALSGHRTGVCLVFPVSTSWSSEATSSTDLCLMWRNDFAQDAPSPNRDSAFRNTTLKTQSKALGAGLCRLAGRVSTKNCLQQCKKGFGHGLR